VKLSSITAWSDKDTGSKKMSTSSKGTILIIEDNALSRRVSHDMLDSAGYNMLLAEDGKTGRDLVKAKKPDLIMLDLVLPGLHGFEVLKLVRGDAETKDIPILIMTELGEQDDIRKGLELGANDYMMKGLFGPREILAKVRAAFTQAENKSGTVLYKLSINKTRKDAGQLENDIGLIESFNCPQCKEEVLQELIPDFAKTDSHWFIAHFVCPKCQKSF
jgi:DNA-binding response OmpR family regulator